MVQLKDWKQFYLLIPCMAAIFCWTFQPWGRIGNIIFCGITSIMVLSTFLINRHQIAKSLEKKQAQLICEFASHKRHDLMNHVQVLMGYIAMDRLDLAQRYLESLAEMANLERKLSDFRMSELVAFFVTLPYTYKKWKWKLHASGQLANVSEKLQVRILSTLSLLFEKLSEMGANRYEWETIELSLAVDLSQVTITIRVKNTNGEPIRFVPESQKFSIDSIKLSEEQDRILVKL